ncbi:MAG TPA: Mur ligase domain-containing protein, partial [Aggregatilineales bacterium]|nr:Mur ligase domain-containing protein [Aggregatilineales bacterium]
MEFIAGQKIHFIGIGGFGISAIARILLERGFTISGSDKNANALTEALGRDGATIYVGHAPEYVHGADMVIRTSAVKDDHVEV